MKKDIYIIKNTVNNKVYIGQSVNVAQRWYHHLDEAKHQRTNCLIHKAMRKYGYDKFYYQILESGVENYDEREKHWIAHYNSLVPTGYNIAVGGSGTGAGINNPNASIDALQLKAIRDMLMHSGYSCRRIAKEFGYSEWTVWAINNGSAFFDSSLKYPLHKNNRYTKELIKQVKYALKYELDMSITDISKLYNIDTAQVSEINQGRVHAFSNEVYPLRTGKCKGALRLKTVMCIISDLQNSTLMQKDIAKKYNVSVVTVSGINLGRSYRQTGVVYPLRETYQNCISRKNVLLLFEVGEIENQLITTTKSMREIAKEFNVGLTLVLNINNGLIKKYRKEGVDYPIRKMHKH